MEDTKNSTVVIRPEGFGLIFWGLLLVILDFSINNFDILPDFVGYILTAIGAGRLIAASRKFKTTQICCWILAVMSLADLIDYREIESFLGLIHRAINCIMIWFLLGGIMDTASDFQKPDLVQKASVYRIMYVILMAITVIAGLVLQGTIESLFPILLLVVPFVILMILICSVEKLFDK